MKKIASIIFGTGLIFLLLVFSKTTCASHALGGEITYTHLHGLTYQINITYYTDIPQPPNDVDRPVLDCVHLGDGSIMSFMRDSLTYIPNNIQVNYYSEIHIYPSSGTYLLYLVNPNREGNIVNIPNSFFTPFVIASELNISASMCPNSSVAFSDKPIFHAQHNRAYTQNVAILNPDHDSISFELVPCLGENAQVISDYYFPFGFSIDPVSGELKSDATPDSVGIYAFAIKITEWRNDIPIGYVIRDYALDISSDTINTYFFDSPALAQDTGGNFYSIINPGDTLSLNINYTDSSNYPALAVYGEAFSVGNPSIVNITSGNSITASAMFSWSPDTLESRPYPYIFTFRGKNDILETDLTVLVYVNGLKYDSCYSSPHIDVPEISARENSLNIFPNPATDEFHFQIRNYTQQPAVVSMYDAFGKLVFEKTTVDEIETISTKNFPSGFYFVKVTGADYNVSAKVCVVRE